MAAIIKGTMETMGEIFGFPAMIFPGIIIFPIVGGRG